MPDKPKTDKPKRVRNPEKDPLGPDARAYIVCNRHQCHIIQTGIMDKVNIARKFSHIHEYWKPYIAAELNGQHVKLDKLKGEFVFHHHEHEDEMFLVVKGRFRMEFRDRHEWIEEGEFIVVPRGVEHKPVAAAEAAVLLLEPASTRNTGDVLDERTVEVLERI